MNTFQAILAIIANDSFRNDSFYTLALFILAHYEEIEKYSLRSLAKESFTSLSTISSFLKFLGFSNYTDFKTSLAGARRIRLQQMNDRFANTDMEKLKQDLLYFCPAVNTDEIIETAKRINEDIHACKRMVILGAAYPLALCVNYQEDMLVMGRHVVLRQTSRNPEADLRDLKEDDMILLITFSGTYLSVEPQRREILSGFPDLSVITLKGADLSDLPYRHRISFTYTRDNEEYNHSLITVMNILKRLYYDTYFRSK